MMLGMGLNDFCKQIGAVLRDIPDRDAPKRIADILPGVLATPDLLTPKQRALPPKGYGRHDVFICPNDRFSVLAAIWPAGIYSPIHDHLTWCAFGVYEGVLHETRYRPAHSNRAGGAKGKCSHAVETAFYEHNSGFAGYLPPQVSDIHCIHNPTDQTVISIHVYGGNAEKLGPNVETIYSVEA
jgi:predicted metal-dependent enzyme (double-stranded beta helix superfamily)